MLRYTAPLGEGQTIHVAFTTVAQGNLAGHVGDHSAAVATRRHQLASDLRLPGPAHFMWQTHSTKLARLEGPVSEAGPEPEVDALVTTRPDTPLAVLTADCLPVAFVAEGERGTATAVAHAGRRGLLDGILTTTLAALREDAGADASITAWIGPAICGRCYEVPADMQHDAAARLPGIASTTSWGTPALDLPAAATRLLEGEGAAVVRSGVCTLEEEHYYSYRRSQDAGRLAGLIWQAEVETEGV